MKPEQERVKTLLTDTVTLLCKNGLAFSDQLSIDGLLCITVDDKDTFCVHITHNHRETEETDKAVSDSEETEVSPPASPSSQRSDGERRRRRKRQHSSNENSTPSTPQGAGAGDQTPQEAAIRVKQERLDDDLEIVESKTNVFAGLNDSRGRVPPLHGGHDPSLPDMSASDISFDNLQATFLGYDQQGPSLSRHASGEPPTKRHLGSGGANSDNSQSSDSISASMLSGQGLPNLSDPTSPSSAAATALPPGLPASLVDMMATSGMRRSRDSAEKQYLCTAPGCTAGFFHHQNLRRHVKLKHCGRDEASVKCNLCGNVYSQTSALYRHQRDKHGDTKRYPQQPDFFTSDDVDDGTPKKTD